MPDMPDDIQTQLRILAQFSDPRQRFWYTAVKALCLAICNVADAIREDPKSREFSSGAGRIPGP